VIAAEAGAKVSFRLVPGMDPERILQLFRSWVVSRAPADAVVEVQGFNGDPAIEVPVDSRFVEAARAVLAQEYGRPAVLVGSGGSIPVVESLRRVLGMNSLLMGFGLDDDQVHSPNEKFELRCLDHGTNAHARLLAALAPA
jgi:acetylornithine deacetylase/succinyl-diaminopimelate desuccinylase-like protein